jgi:hypothetical protein
LEALIMSQNDKGTLHDTSDGGLAGKHTPGDSFDLLVAPTGAGNFNTARARLTPVACFRVDDIRFAFGSSFVASDPTNDKNDIRAELRLLVNLMKEHPQSPLSVFGHADPVGDDDLNKRLSGHRATVIYALLISNKEPDAAVALWQRVAKEEHWDASQRQTMQNTTGLPADTPDEQLFKAYMQQLSPPELKLGKKDFLAQGADAQGKGDYQGCSEFNPKLIFSSEKNKQFESASDKTARNDANATNRRVMVLLFRKGSKVDFAQWPCPRATEGVAGCRARFWSDGEKRRNVRLLDKDRTFDETQDTFACRFYHRLVTNSPCESELTLVKIRLFDPQGRSLPFAPCLVTEVGKDPRPDRASGAPPTPAGNTAALSPGSASGGDKEDAVITLRVQKLPTTVNLKWSRPKAGEGPNSPPPEVFKDKEKEQNGYKYEFEMDVTVDIPKDDDQVAAPARMKNLGYIQFFQAPDNIRAFQRDYKSRFAEIVEDGTLNPPTVEATKTAHENTDPVTKAGSQIAVKR